MITKILELRDKGTFIPILATLMNPTAPNWNNQAYLLGRAGYHYVDNSLVILTNANGGRKAYCDPYDWGDRTYKVAHLWIEEHFDELSDGDVVDVEFILGETTEKKRSERETDYEALK